MRLAPFTLAFALCAVPAAAQDVTVVQDGARYAMRATPEGTLRLDTNTGETTLCTTAGGRLRCAVSAEERLAYEKEIDALGSRVEALERRLVALETARSAAESTDGGDALSGEERRSVDKAVSMADRALRGFAGVVKQLRRDFETAE